MIEAVCARKKTALADAKTVMISDVTLFRDRISAGLKRLKQLDVVAPLFLAEAVDFLSGNEVEIVIFDTSRRRALAHAATIKQQFPDIYIIASGVGATEDVLAGAKFGVAALVDESGTIEDINDAALRTLQGQSFCSPELTAQFLLHISTLAQGRQARASAILTERENEIAGLVRLGLSNKEIAQRLRISPATVKNHVHNILEKLELTSRGAIGSQMNLSARGQVSQMTAS